MQRSIVTGGAGFIGSHVVDSLMEQGDQVLVIDDLSSGKRANLPALEAADRLELAHGSIIDTGFVARTVAEFQPTRIFHLAAQVDVRKAVADPVNDAAINVTGTINLLEAARQVGDGEIPFVFASTGGAIYGEGDGRALPLTEGEPNEPETPYGASKLTGEIYLDLYRRVYGVRSVATRFGNVYGPRQDPHGEAGVVAIFCSRYMAGTSPTVFGDGLQTRDFIYVGDAVAAMVAAADRAAEVSEPLGPFNVGTGLETSVLDLVETLNTVTGTPLEAELAPARLGEVQRIAISAELAGRELGWSSQVGLEDGMRRTWEWARSVEP